MNKDKICFVISPIGEEGSETRNRSNLTYEYIIRPAVEEFGYHLTRADYIKEPGIITSQIIDQIFESSLVIADLSDNNPNVFYELAIRHIIQKPYIQMMRSGQKIPFDINGLRTIPFDTDLELANNAKKELSDQIKSIEDGKFNTNNPITSAIHQSNIKKMLTSSENIKPDNFSKVVIESVSELRSIVLDLRAEFRNSKLTDNRLLYSTKKLENDLENLEHQIYTINNKIEEANNLIERSKDKMLVKSTISYIEDLKDELNDLMKERFQILNSTQMTF